jgi:hypothetical protein
LGIQFSFSLAPPAKGHGSQRLIFVIRLPL